MRRFRKVRLPSNSSMIALVPRVPCQVEQIHAMNVVHRVWGPVEALACARVLYWVRIHEAFAPFWGTPCLSKDLKPENLLLDERGSRLSASKNGANGA